VYVLLFKGGRVSAPYKIALTGYLIINGGFDPEPTTGRFVTVGNVGLAYSSDRGKTWKLVDTGGWVQVGYGDGTFVAAATNKAAYSDDGGDTWTETTLPIGWGLVVGNVVYGNGVFVAGSDKGLAYSLDKGRTWTKTSLPGIRGIAYGNNKFVAVPFRETTAEYYYSSDGIQWQTGQFPQPAGWNDIAYGDGRFVAIAPPGVAYSADGVNWTMVTMQIPIGEYVRHSIDYGNGRFIQNDNFRWFAYSDDGGETWINGTLPGYATDTAYGDGTFVALGFGNSYRSGDGINWTQGGSTPFYQSSYSITYGEYSW
jgi:photosystem II stability/assembly factor-like uncharacterized protein